MKRYKHITIHFSRGYKIYRNFALFAFTMLFQTYFKDILMHEIKE